MFLIFGKSKARIFTLAFFYFFCSSLFCFAQEPRVDILVFSVHPDDAILGCAGTILKALQNHKKVKVVFFTNGDGDSTIASRWFKKEPDKLTAKDYITLGKARQEEAKEAMAKLGLSGQDLIFLSYPENGLSAIWQEDYEGNYSSETTGVNFSAYNRTYKMARQGYAKENLLFDLQDIFRDYLPQRIYCPHPLDAHKDHQAANRFINLALNESMIESKNQELNSTSVSYYSIHSSSDQKLDENLSALEKNLIFSQPPSRREDIANFKLKKKEALEAYQIQLNIEPQKAFLEGFIQDSELFWDVPVNKSAFLKQLEQEWVSIAHILQQNGYQVNLAPVIDLASNIEDRNIYLARRERLFSSDPDIVVALASAMIKGMRKEGITPVLKHFPGLGSAFRDTHNWLPQIEISEEELFKGPLLTFKNFIKTGHDVWVMVDHAVYPFLDKEPASLSYKIQTGLLRKKLGFQGIIITDEFLCMQAIKEYARNEKINEPYIGEIAVRAFQAGADLITVYPHPQEAEKVISHIIEAVKQALKEARINQDDFDDSLKRILKTKEKTFHRPLVYLINEMSLDEKICQRIIIDAFENIDIFQKYNLAGVHARKYAVIKSIQERAKIPLFIIAQHEGGWVNDFALGLSSRSAYTIGKEFERLMIKAGGKITSAWKGKKSQSKPLLRINYLSKNRYRQVKAYLLSCLQNLITVWSNTGKEGYLSLNPNILSPLIVSPEGEFMLRPFEEAPMEWMRKFPDQEIAECAYSWLKEIFLNWKTRYRPSKECEQIISNLISLRKEIEKARVKEAKAQFRILCLAAHPDDEDAEALIYFKRNLNCSTYLLLATRGEAGENEIGPELYEELGFLRAEELERAASILGIKKTYYLGNKDFGYCLDLKEAFENWDRKDTLEKLVYFYRLIKPHLIITKHNKSMTQEQCQHQALAILAEEAFDLAADPKAYPEMIKQGLLPWQPLKLYVRAGDDSLTNKDRVAIDTAELILPENKNVYQMATAALKEHRSQGDWQHRQEAKAEKIFYQLVKSSFPIKEKDSFLAGIPLGRDTLFKKESKFAPSGIPGVKIIQNLRIGLIEENTHILSIALQTLGYDFQKIDARFLKENDFSKFDTLLIGQGYSKFLTLFAGKEGDFLDFVEKGGNLVVLPQYYSENETLPLAPYPLKVSFSPITDEHALVKVLLPEHSLFNFPNRISEQDFLGWRQERGLNFAFGYSDKYSELLACQSSKKAWVKGGYLVADYGKGSFIYTTLAWYRQLREFHLGAYKNLANMLAYFFTKE